MVIPNNGTIEIKQSSGSGGFDENGDPLEISDNWDAPIECRINTVNKNNEGRYTDGKFIQSSYIVYIDGVNEITAENVKLTRQGVLLGEFEVQNCEYLRLVGRNKITV